MTAARTAHRNAGTGSTVDAVATRPVDGRAPEKPMKNNPLLMAVLSVFVLTSTVVAAAGPALAGSTTDASTQLDVGVELEQEETVTRGGNVSVSAYVNNRADEPLRNATVSLLVDTDDDGTVEASEEVASHGLDLAADEHSETELTYTDVGLAPGTYAYAARVTHGEESARSYTEGTLTVEADGNVESEASVSRICFDYGQYGGNVNLEVNGQQLYKPTTVDAAPPNGIDGATVGGATVSVTSSPANGGRTGHVEITGDIHQFRIGGQELMIDNVEFGPRRAPKATVGFNHLSPAKSTYVVGDQFRADGVDIQVEPFIYWGGSTTSNGRGLYQTSPPARSGGVAPEFYPNNVNLAFDIGSAVNSADDEEGEEEEPTESTCGTEERIEEEPTEEEQTDEEEERAEAGEERAEEEEEHAEEEHDQEEHDEEGEEHAEEEQTDEEEERAEEEHDEKEQADEEKTHSEERNEERNEEGQVEAEQFIDIWMNLEAVPLFPLP